VKLSVACVWVIYSNVLMVFHSKFDFEPVCKISLKMWMHNAMF